MKKVIREEIYGMKRKELFHGIWLLLLYITPILTYKENALGSFVSGFVLISVLLFWFDDRYYLLAPIFIFFSMKLMLFQQVKIFDIYAILFIVKFLMGKNIIILKRLIAPFVLVTCYSLAVVTFRDLRTAIAIIISFTFIVTYLSSYLIKKKNLKQFLKLYVYATLSASIFGLLRLSISNAQYVIINGAAMEISRNIGTFTDPNYFGFFINIAIFSVLSLGQAFGRRQKYTYLVVLYVTLISTMSFTALLCNMLGFGLYMLMKRGSKLQSIFLTIAAVAMIILLYNYAMKHNIPILTDFLLRIQEKSIGINSGDLNSITTSRSAIWSTHYSYFKEQSILNILFGGNYVTDYGRDLIFSTVSHESYLDMLLNFGLVGTLVLISSLIHRTVGLFTSYYREKQEVFLAFFLIKYVWIFYAFGLSMFPAWMFNIFFLI